MRFKRCKNHRKRKIKETVTSLFKNGMSMGCMLSFVLQGLGDMKTTLISSHIELFGKIIITYTLVAAMGYFGVIIAEPIVWAMMVIPLIIKWRTEQTKNLI